MFFNAMKYLLSFMYDKSFEILLYFTYTDYKTFLHSIKSHEINAKLNINKSHTIWIIDTFFVM